MPFCVWYCVVWFSDEGYQHHLVGQKVSQIQAVLARRCVTIGELQMHLLRAGWQRGVASWGVLGDGGEWAPVAGNDGRMPSETTVFEKQDKPPLPPRSPFRRPAQQRRVSSEMLDIDMPPPKTQELPGNAPTSNVSNLPQRAKHRQLYYTNLSVRNLPGGHIENDDPALAAWSVDCMSIIRG